MNVTFTIPRELAPGSYRVCVELNPDGGDRQRQYSEDNDRGCSSSALRVVNLPIDVGPGR